MKPGLAVQDHVDENKPPGRPSRESTFLKGTKFLSEVPFSSMVKFILMRESERRTWLLKRKHFQPRNRFSFKISLLHGAAATEVRSARKSDDESAAALCGSGLRNFPTVQQVAHSGPGSQSEIKG